MAAYAIRGTMAGFIFRAVMLVAVLTLIGLVLAVLGVDVTRFVNTAANTFFGVIFAILLIWGSWEFFKAGSQTLKPPVRENGTGYLFSFVLSVAFLAFCAAAMIGSWSSGIVVAVPLALLAWSAIPRLAKAGIELWEREQSRRGASTLYGNARFAVFDADLDRPLVSGLIRPVGSGPILGFYQMHRLPTFFHRLLAWTSQPLHIIKHGFQSLRLVPLVYDGPSHLLTVAPARSGKGTSVIIPNLLTLNRSVICVDPKGENAAITKRKRESFGPVFLLNPFNEHSLGTARFNPLATLSIDSPTVVADTSSLAEALIVDEGKEPFFTNSARDLIRALILHLLETKGSRATLNDMRRLLTLPHGEGEHDKFGILIFEMMESRHSFIAQPAGRFKSADRTTQSIISTAIAQTAFLDDPAIARVFDGNDFDLRRFKEGVSTLYVILPSRYLVAYARFFRLVVVSALDQLTATPGGKRVTMILDEFAQLGQLSSIETAFGLAAGYNVQLWPFLQDLNQLKDLYKTRWETFLANAGVVQWFAPNDMTTAEYLSKRLGNRTERTKTVTPQSLWTMLQTGMRRSIAEGETGVPLQTPQDLINLNAEPFDEFFASTYPQILNVAGVPPAIRCMRAPYFSNLFRMHENVDGHTYEALPNFHEKDWKPMYDDNPFHTLPG